MVYPSGNEDMILLARAKDVLSTMKHYIGDEEEEEEGKQASQELQVNFCN